MSNEYPGEDLDRFEGKKIQKVVYNLYSDKYFVPIFKETFDEVSTKNLKLIYKNYTSARCSYKLAPGQWSELSDPANDALGGKIRSRNQEKFSYEVLKSKVIELRKIRNEYKHIVAEIQNKDAKINFETLQEWMEKIESDYSEILMNSEINFLKSIIESSKNRIADENFNTKLKEITQLRNDYNTLERISNFKAKNKQLYNALSANYKKTVDGQIQAKINEILSVLIKQVLSNISLSNLKISELNDFRKTFNDRYEGFRNQTQIKNINSQIEEAKIDLIVKNTSEIKTKIVSTTTIIQLKEIENIYLSDVNKQRVFQIENLLKQIKKQEAKIYQEIKANEKRLITQREKNAQLAESEAMTLQGFKFSASGLENGEILGHLFKGDFKEIPFKRNSRLFHGLLVDYIQLLGNNCAAYLPDDKVQIFEKECETEKIIKNGFGTIVNRYCVKWYKIPTGVYTTQELILASDKVRNLRKGEAIGESMDLLSEMIDAKNFSDPITNRVSDNTRFKSDIKKIISLYGCDSKTLKRFDDNLVRFANDESPIKLVGESLNGSFFENKQDYTKLIVDLIKNRELDVRFKYIKNSVVDIKIVSKDSKNRPLKVTSNYKYYPYRDGVEVGKVQVIFKQGVPNCIYFVGLTKNCIKPDKNVVLNFMKGDYIIY